MLWGPDFFGLPKPTKGDKIVSSKKLYILAAVLAISVLSLLATAAPSMAQTRVYHGYVLGGPYPTKDQANAYVRTHRGAERWRLWVRRYAWIQARNIAVYHRPNWKYVWNEEWVVRVIVKESGGNPLAVNGPYRGLLQIYYGHSSSNLFWGPTNIAVGAMLFTRLAAQPWPTRYVGVYWFAPRR